MNEDTSIQSYIHAMAVRARAAAGSLRQFGTDAKNAALHAIADALEADKEVHWIDFNDISMGKCSIIF